MYPTTMKDRTSFLVKKKLVLMTLFLMNSAPSSSQVSDSIDIFIKQYIQQNYVAGFSYGIVKDNKLVSYNSYGKANIEQNIPMNIDGVMNIASISKTITATAAMQLWEKGLLHLDSDINEYLDFTIHNPYYPDKPITLSQILTHTSSIQDGESYGHSYTCGDPKISLHDWIYGNLVRDGKYYNDGGNFGTWAPGEKRKYSNVAFGLLGYVVEKIAGMPFNEYCREYIFRPLKMNNTGWFLEEIDTNDHIILYNYIWNVGLLKDYPTQNLTSLNDFCPLCLYSFPNYTDGLVRTSLRQLSNFLVAIINGGSYEDAQILKESTVKKMLTLQIDENNSQGLCWSKREFEGLWGHSGSDPGVETNMFFNPESKIGVITFQNTSTWRNNSFDVVKKLYSASSRPK